MPAVKYKIGNEFYTIPIVSEETPFPIYNGLDAESAGMALDAVQGKVLSDGKFDKANVFNGVNMVEEGYALDARQGKLLYERTGGFHQGVDLTTLFESASEFQIAVAAGDFSKIHVGDYWPLTLNGSYYDYSSRSTITLTEVVVEMEIAAIDPYMYFGDTGDLTTGIHHVVMISRDLLPNTTKYSRSSTAWYKSSASCPWLGSAVYATLNTLTNGLVSVVNQTELGAFIYSGANNGGMRFYVEGMNSSDFVVEDGIWIDRGMLWLPTETELFGKCIEAFWTYYEDYDIDMKDSWATTVMERTSVQFPLFSNTKRSFVKRLGKGGTAAKWWTGTCDYPMYTTVIESNGIVGDLVNSSAAGFPLCFIVA